MSSNRHRFLDKCEICIIGNPGVGKRCIIAQFYTGVFVGETDYDPCVCEDYRKQLIIDGKCCLMVLSSNNIFQDYRPIYEQWIAQAQAIAIVYSITDRKSFEDIREHRDMLRETREKKGQDVDIPIVIVGNKADKETERAVSKAEGENLAKEFGYPFFEVSAKENATVNEPVEELVRGYRRRQQKKDRERAARIEERKKQEEKDERKNTGCLRGKRCVVM